jgi:sec-independent protein translocase protein TatA
MTNVGTIELLIIVLVLLLLFGGKKIPEFVRGLTSAVKEFQKASGTKKAEDKKKN